MTRLVPARTAFAGLALLATPRPSRGRVRPDRQPDRRPVGRGHPGLHRRSRRRHPGRSRRGRLAVRPRRRRRAGHAHRHVRRRRRAGDRELHPGRREVPHRDGRARDPGLVRGRHRGWRPDAEPHLPRGHPDPGAHPDPGSRPPTPEPGQQASTPTPAPTGSVEAATGRPNITPPPTDTVTSSEPGTGSALPILLLLGSIVAVAALITPSARVRSRPR